MTARRVLRPLAHWVAARVTAAYAEPPPAAGVTCEAMGGPCDGKRWRLPRAGAPIWLADPHGEHHLYVATTSDSGTTAVVRYRYAVSAGSVVA